MTPKPSSARLAGTLCMVGLSGLAFIFASESGTSDAATSRQATERPGLVTAAARVETDSYVATMLTPGTAPYKVGDTAKVEINIMPKAGFHINPQFPFKVKASDPPPENISYPKSVLLKADGTFTPQRGSFQLQYIPKKAGKVDVQANVSLSVCSEVNCVVDKIDLAATVDAR